MRLTAWILPLLVSLSATFAYAQTNNITQVQHVIIVVQENRTPDNLFGSDAFASQRQLPDADLAQNAQCSSAIPTTVTLVPFALDACFDPNHGHGYPLPTYAPNNAWVTSYDGGKMDGACATYVNVAQGCQLPAYPQLTYVDNTTGTIQPYFDIAKNYGYANYMFQTNQGPSFEAHQFLFSGTSAPTASNDPTLC
jgi:phospholipase C